MKVILIHYRLTHSGGLERRLVNYARWFHENGHQTEVWVAKVDPEIHLPEGIKIHRVSPGWMIKPFRKWYFHKRIKRQVSKVQADFILSLGRQFSPHAILDPGNHLAYMEGMQKKSKSLKDRISLSIDREIYQQTRLILAASEYIKSYTIRLGAPPERVQVLFPPLDISQFNPDLRKEKNEIRKAKGFEAEDRIFLFVSFSHDRKGLKVLLDAFAQIENPHFKLVVIGKPVKQRLPSNVIAVGKQQDLAHWYCMADACVHPARMEPFGQVIAESLACGTPVLVSPNVGAKEIVKPEYGEQLPDWKAETWAKAILEVPKKEYHIPADFGRRLKLDVDTHMQKMLSYWQTQNASHGR